jgi:hypothetical protein
VIKLESLLAFFQLPSNSFGDGMMWEIWVLLVIAVVLLAGILVVEVLQWMVAAGLWAEVKQRRRARRKRRQR